MVDNNEYLSSNIGGNLDFKDTFWGPKDKKYMDRLAKDMVKIRGINLIYWQKLDSPVRTDGDKPGSNNPDLPLFAPKGRAASAALYGESIDIGPRIDSVSREITPSWGYSDPIQFRAITFDAVQTDTPDERGHFEVRTLMMHAARAMCEDAGIIPQIGDVVEMPTLLNSFYDVALVKTDHHRFGGTGFFTCYELSLKRNTSFLPQRKELPEEQI